MSEIIRHCLVVLMSITKVMLKDAKLFYSFLLYEQHNVFYQRFVRKNIVTTKFNWTSPLRYLLIIKILLLLLLLLFTFIRKFTLIYLKHIVIILFSHGWTDHSGSRPFVWGFSITLKHTAFSKIPLGEWSARHNDLYQTTHGTHKRHIRDPGGIRTRNPINKAGADRAATGIDTNHVSKLQNFAAIFWLLYTVV